MRTTAVLRVHTYTYEYDSFGRPKSLTLTRGDSVYTIHANTYDNIGRLTRTAYGNGCRTSYSYKVAGALDSVTAANAAEKTTFSQTLRYAKGINPSYSGNVSTITWRGDDKLNRHYAFTYDGVGRLVSATYSEPYRRPSASPATGTPSYSTSYTYGLDSRPLTVHRSGVRTVAFTDDTAVPDFGEVDILTFTYKGSRLTKVHDAAEDIVYTGAADFNDGANVETEYTYDEDGRLTSDANKSITSISYNAIGMPSEVTFDDGSSITNCYSADGMLLQRVHKEPTLTILPFANWPIIINPPRPLYKETTKDYIGPLTFTSGFMSRVDTPNGFIASDRIYYYVKDYQGNVRQVADADGTVVQDNNYYPYGMLMGESSDIIASARGYYDVSFNPYFYGSKEYLTTGGANLLDFTARTYDPSTLLFHTQDPKATDYTPLNTYLYCGSDPVNRIDPSGTTVIALSEEAIRNICNTLTVNEASYVRFINGVLDHDRLNTSNSSSENITALKALSNSTVTYIFDVCEGYESDGKFRPFNETGMAGITLMPNAENYPSPDSNVYILTYKGISEEHQITNTAHEGYGHAYFYELKHLGFDVNPLHTWSLIGVEMEFDTEFGIEIPVNVYGETNIKLLNQIRTVENQALDNYKSRNK